MAYVLGIEPSAATAVDLRTGRYASRRRAPYPRSLVNLAAILRDPERACRIARKHGVNDYPVDPDLFLEMHIHDRLASGFSHVEQIPAYEPDYAGPVTYYEGIRYGEPEAATAQLVRAFPEAKIAAIPAIFSGSRTEVIDTARIIKEANPGLLVVVGGPYASYDYSYLLGSNWIDVVVIGEAWLSFPAVVHAFLRGQRLDRVPGIAYRSSIGQVVDNVARLGSFPTIHDYDLMPMPAWDLLDFHPYDVIGLTHVGETPTGQLVAPIDSEVGCGLKCRFCASGLLNAGRLVKKSGSRLIREIHHLARTFERNVIHFDSDNPLVDNERALHLFRLLIDLNRTRWEQDNDIIRFAFPNGTAPWTFRDPDLIPLMLDAGLTHISIAVESGSAKTLKRLGKSPKVPKLAYDVIASLRDFESHTQRYQTDPLVIEVFIMLGLPGETEADLGETLAFCERVATDHRVIIAPFYYAPLHGTPLFDEFFLENPRARKLAWPVLGWLGTEKKDDPISNARAAEVRQRCYTLARNCRNQRYVRL